MMNHHPQIKRIKVSDDVTLKEIELSDAPIIFKTIKKQRSYLGKWLPFVALTQTQSDTEEFINSIHHTPAAMREFVFVILYDLQFCGLIGFKGTDRINRRTELGYWLSEAYQKKGIVTASVRSLLDFAFGELGINRIQLRCAVENHPSKSIPLRLGFQPEEIERAGELLSGGEFADLQVYSMLLSEWKSQ
jgi:ribosomal-protein-serine acetyltransferase